MSISSSKEGVSGRAIRGHLDLRSDLRADGTPYLSRQSFRAPIHVGKGHLDSGALVVQLANPTAGFFDGDRLDLRATAGEGTHLVLSTPGASRVHTARGKDAAVCSQSLVVESGAFAEWIPEPFIPQVGARYVQSTTIHLEKDAGLLFFEWIAPGRVARGEVFAYESLRWELDLRVAGQLIARERYELKPGDFSTSSLRERFHASHHVTVYVAGVAAEHWPGELLDGLSSDHVYLGHGPLAGGVYLVRALCDGGSHARQLIGSLRHALYLSANRAMPALGRWLF